MIFYSFVPCKSKLAYPIHGHIHNDTKNTGACK
jgi:hypothetical protein